MSKARAFTLVEILIVVLILGVLAAAVLPKFSNATAMARGSMLADNLRIIRCQLAVFQGQHRGIAPGCTDTNDDTADEALFVLHMTKPTDSEGNIGEVSDSTFRFGPYLREMPVNSVNNRATIQIVGAEEEIGQVDDSHGWIYQPSTMTFMADSAGQDENGKAYAEY